jgi:RHS repeat-associated protein
VLVVKVPRWARVLAVVLAFAVGGETVGVEVAEAAPPPEDRETVEEPLAPAGDADASPEDVAPLPTAEPAEPEGDPDAGASVVPGSASFAPVSPGSGTAAEASEPEREVIDRRTATQDVFENEDGTFTMHLYSEPKYFDSGGGEWTEIDNSVVPAEGRPGWVENAANSWTVAFGPLSADADAVVEVTSPLGRVSFVPVVDEAGGLAAGEVIEPEVDDEDGEVVVYRDVWPGVDLRYTVQGDRVEEEIVINEPSQAEFAFSVPDADLAPLTTDDVTGLDDVVEGDPGGFAVPGTGMVVSAPETLDVDGRPVDGAAGTAADVDTAGPGSVLTVSVDDEWLDGLDDDQFPVVIDPSISPGPSAFANFKADGTIDSATSSQRTGNPTDPGNNYWRGLVAFPYEQVWQSNPAGTAVVSATLNLTQDAGSTSTRKVEVHEATSLAYSGVGQEYDEADIASSGTIDLTHPLQTWVAFQQANKAFFLTGDETAGTFTYKRFATSLTIVYNRPPPAPTAVSPVVDATVATATPTLKLDPVTDVDGQAVSYHFRVATNPDGTGGFVHSHGGQATPEWTVPAGSLRNGVTYYWQAYAHDGQHFSPPSALRAFRIDQRLGAGGPSPSETVGPLTANLATGNLSVSTSTPSFPTVSGSAGVSFTYDSLGDTTDGLTGRYYSDEDNDGVIASGEPLWLSRVDPAVDFDWGAGAPESLRDDGWIVRWTGKLVVPSTGTWKLGARAAGRVRVKVDPTTVVDAWNEGAAPATPIYESGTHSWIAGQTVSITVEYSESSGDAAVELWARNTSASPADPGRLVPSGWLSTADRPLPQGWSLSTGVEGELAWVRAHKNNASVTLYDADGSTAEFKRQGSGAAAGYKAPAGYDDVVSVNPAGQVVVLGSDGTKSTFGADGSLVAAVTGLDDRQPAALGYTWAPLSSGGPVRLTAITDPVSGRQITLTYQGGSGSCPTVAGFDAAPPSGMLCRVDHWDGTRSDLLYVSGRLARIVDPGSDVTDLGYDAGGRLTTLRDGITMDAIAAGVVANDSTTRFEVTYDTAGKVAELRPPVANGYRPTTHVTYGIGQTMVNVDGRQEPHGFTRKVTWDSAGRMLTSVDATNVTGVTQVWAATDLLRYSTDATGLRSSTVYDAGGRVTATWGPAPASCFTNEMPNGSCPVPGTQSSYDESINGLAATYWTNKDLQGPPLVHDTGIGNSSGILSVNWTTTGPPGLGVFDNWSARFTGEVLLPQAGTYQFMVASDDGARLWIDDVPVIDSWTGGSTLRLGTTTANATANTRHRIRIDYFDLVSTAQIGLYWTTPSNSSYTLVPGANLFPGYGLETRRVDENGRTTTYAYGTTTGSGVGPEQGLATAVTTDPAGLNLVDQTAYESPGSGYLRRTSHTLPAGNASTDAYYGATETRDNPCTAASDPAPQAGLVKTMTAPDPDGTGPQTAVVREAIYNAAGATVATRVGSEPWTCTTYDSRGRPTTTVHPAAGSQPARTVTDDYAVAGNPLHSSVTDVNGTIERVVDLQGRDAAYKDVWGATSFTGFDAAGELRTTTDPYGTVTRYYDAAGRGTELRLDGKVVARTTYDAVGRFSQVTYPTDDGNAANGVEAGNGTRSAPVTYDAHGRLTGLAWETIGGTAITGNQVTYNLAGDVVNETIDGVDARPSGDNFTYDNAGRLTDAHVPGGRYQYAFAATGGCGTLTAAGRNTNRTSMTVTPSGGAGVTTNYCYDNADRLTSSSNAAVGSVTYDGHGNTTGIFGETHTYDAVDRHLATAKGGTTVSYELDAADRIIARRVDGTTVARYGSGAPGDAPSYVADGSGALQARDVSLPGGVLLTYRAATNATWSYPNIHGDVTALANQAGAKQGATVSYDPYGNPVAGTLPDNAPGNLDYGWLGQHQRPIEHEPGLQPTVEMGARQYSPLLGRFLEVDPIEGGSANDYDYTSGNPIGSFDLDGTRRCTRDQRLYAKRLAGISTRQSGWSCNVFTSSWRTLRNSGAREICGWTVPAYICVKTMYQQERWRDYSLSRRGRHVVVSVRQRRKRMRTCVRAIVTGHSQCHRWWTGARPASVNVYR